ncbi:MAG TPA: hypothetical protein VGG01_19210 [Xanthobacteraceae bacterium]|jgi:hypothetical protein
MQLTLAQRHGSLAPLLAISIVTRGPPMTVASISAGGDFRVGDVMSRAWSLFTGNIIFFLGVPLLIYASYYAVGWALRMFFGFAGARNPGSAAFWLVLVLVAIVVFGLYVIGQGVLLYGAFQRLRGQPLRPIDALQRVVGRLVPLVGLGILFGLALMIVTFITAMIFALIASVLHSVAIILLPAIYAPAAFLLVMWIVVVPACLVENLGPVASMARSAGLTSGFRWKVFGILLLLILLSLVGVAIQFVAAYAGSWLAVLVGTVWSVVLLAYWNCTVIMTYHDLRVAKEGVDTTQIASVFD